MPRAAADDSDDLPGVASSRRGESRRTLGDRPGLSSPRHQPGVTVTVSAGDSDDSCQTADGSGRGVTTRRGQWRHWHPPGPPRYRRGDASGSELARRLGDLPAAARGYCGGIPAKDSGPADRRAAGGPILKIQIHLLILQTFKTDQECSLEGSSCFPAWAQRLHSLPH